MEHAVDDAETRQGAIAQPGHGGRVGAVRRLVHGLAAERDQLRAERGVPGVGRRTADEHEPGGVRRREPPRQRRADAARTARKQVHAPPPDGTVASGRDGPERDFFQHARQTQSPAQGDVVRNGVGPRKTLRRLGQDRTRRGLGRSQAAGADVERGDRKPGRLAHRHLRKPQ